MVDYDERQRLIQQFPCFAALSLVQRKELGALMKEVQYTPFEKIVTENELVDCIYIIVKGKAEVVREVPHRKKMIQVPVAVLGPEEAIGLNDTGFYSATGQRTATVITATDMLLLRLDIKELYDFLHRHQLESSMSAAALQMLRIRLIKQSLPFSKLSHHRLQWLADHVEEISLPAGAILFHEGEKGDKCYLIRTGQIEILTKDENSQERRLALLKPPVLFGEATLITNTLRNATARAIEDCELLMLRYDYLSELMESESDVAKMFMTLMVDRSRPLKNPNVTVHPRPTADGQTITILKNAENGSYFKLSEEGEFIWEQLDGKHTMQDITLNVAEKFKVFAPDVVAGLISKLAKSNFITNLHIQSTLPSRASPFWVRAIVSVRRLLETRIAFGDADAWVTRWYEKYIHYLFTKTAQLIFVFVAIFGFISFLMNAENVIALFSIVHASMLLFLTLIPLSLAGVIFHELGHAFAVKAYGREVHYIGVGWYWLMPIAFTDTSDMWLASRKRRMLVNLAGVYVDVIVAGFSASLIYLIPNPYLQSMLWLFTLYTYIGAFRMLSPLQEMDGYYLLMDWVEKPRLRQAAVIWLVKKFPKAIRQPHLFRENRPEVTYWLACMAFLIIVSLLTYFLQAFIFNVLGIQSNYYVSFILPLLVVLFSCISIIADIRNQD